MNITQIDYPNCEINIVDELGNYTKLTNNVSTSTGLKIFTQNGGNNTAEIKSNHIKFNTIYSNNTSKYSEFGYNAVFKNENENNELKESIISENEINYINNQDDNNLNMFYKGTGIETNNAFNMLSSDSLIIDAPTIDISGQSSFNQPPHSVDPIYGNDLATKGYVDSLVGQYSGGFNLFFNYSVTDSSYSSYKSLGQEVVTSTQQIVDIHTNSGPVLVAQFITLPLGINEIPAGLWNAWVYGAVNNTNGELQYFFTLLKFDGTDETLISTSSLSPDVNASPNNNPDSYHMNATISTPYILSLTDRLIVKLYVQKSGGTSVTIRTFFQNSYYSFTQSTLNAGTTLISSNNIWSGTNNFVLGLTTPTVSSSSSLTLGSLGKTTNIEGNLHIAGSAGTDGQVLTSNGSTATWTTPTTSQWVNDATSDLSMNTYTIHTNSIYPNYDNNTLNIASNSERSGTLNLQTGSNQSNAINIGSTNTTTTLRGTVLSNNIDSLTSTSALNIGTTNASGTTIGRINKITNLQGNLHIAGSAGTNGQVLTSDGTTATWTSLTSNSWVNEATSDLNMSNFSIKVDTINPTSTSSNLNIALGTGRSGQVNIQTTATGSNTINIGSDNSTTIIKGLKTSSIDTNVSETLNIGTTTASGIIIGKAGLSSTIYGTVTSMTVSNFATNNIIAGGVGANCSLWNLITTGSANILTGMTSGTVNILTNTGRTGITNIQTGSTSANTINIGSSTTTTTFNGSVNASLIDTNNLSLRIGNTSANGVIIGRAGQITDLSGNLRIAGLSGTNGQVLTSNGTTATWNSPAWVGTATSNLSMGNLSIIASSLDATDTNNPILYIGTNNLSNIYIGNVNVNTYITGARANSLISNSINTTGGATNGNLWNNLSTATCNIVTSSLRSGITNIQTGSTFENTINIGTGTTTTNISGVVNVSTIKNCSFIDNSGTLTIGNTSATSITIGKSGININVPGYLLPTTFGVNSISVIGASSAMLLWSGSIDGTANILNNAARTGITNIQTATTSANTINIGSATTTTTLGGVVNVSTIKNCSSIDNTETLYIGNVSATDVSIGRSGRNINIMGTLIAYTSTLNDIGTYGQSNAMNLWFGSTDGTATILGRGIRTGILNIQAASTLANTINIGSSTTTTTLGGVVNVSSIKNCSLIDNSGSIIIGNTSASGITIGNTNIQTTIN